MKCCSCGIDIPPEWKSCILKNICPGCDQPIMNDSMQELLQELKIALEEMPNDPEGLAGWLLSNYDLRKIGSGEPVRGFHGAKPNRQNNGDYDESQLRINNPLDKMYRNAGVKPKARTPKNLQNILNEINGGDDFDDQDYGEEDPTEGLDPAEVAQIRAAMNGFSTTDQEDVRQQVRNYREPIDDDGEELSSLHASLRNDSREMQIENAKRIARLEAQRALSDGGEVGLIRRSGR